MWYSLVKFEARGFVDLRSNLYIAQYYTRGCAFVPIMMVKHTLECNNVIIAVTNKIQYLIKIESYCGAIFSQNKSDSTTGTRKLLHC